MNGHVRRLFAFALLLAPVVGPAVADDNLGRLFFTPQQRQDLDRRRQANVQESAVTVNSFVTVNGQVSRTYGKTTVWVNGVPQESTGKPRDPARVSVPGGDGQPSVSLKIGQTLDKVRGNVRDPVGDGTIDTSSEKRGQRP